MREKSDIYGLIAEFDSPEELAEAVRRTREEGYRRLDAYSPFPSEEIEEAMDLDRSLVPPAVLTGGLLGGAGGFFMMWFANVIHYPINVGGRPLNSWPAFIPITFELTVLLASFAALVAMFLLNRLPAPHHPLFNVPDFERASSDRFFLCIQADDPKFDRVRSRDFLKSIKPRVVLEVPA